MFSTHFEKSSGIKFHENPSGGSRDVASGRTQRQKDREANTYDAVNSRFLKFWERTKNLTLPTR